MLSNYNTLAFINSCRIPGWFYVHNLNYDSIYVHLFRPLEPNVPNRSDAALPTPCLSTQPFSGSAFVNPNSIQMEFISTERERERQRDVIIAYSDYLELNSEIMLNIHYSSCWMQALRSSVQVVAQIMHIRTKCSFWWVCRAGRERGRGRDSIQFRCQFNDCTGWIIKIESCTSLLRRPNTQSWSKLDSPGTTIQKNKTNQHSPRFANTGVRWHGCASQ